MPDFYKSIKITQPTPGGPLVETVVGAVQVSTGTAADAGKLVVLNASGVIDSSMVSGSTISVNGSPVTNPNFKDGDIKFHVLVSDITATVHALATTGTSVVIDTNAPSGAGQTLVSTSTTNATWQTISTTTSFSGITSGTNTTATMTVGSGASIVVTGSGVVESTELATNTATPVQINLSAPAHQGQLLISQPGNATALWADPFVQGPWVNGTAIVAPGAMGDGTSNIQPVFVAGYDGTNMRGLLTDSSGRQIVNVNGTVGVTQSTSPWVVAGNLTHNNAAPAANNVGVLPAVASSANPTYNAGDQVLLSTDLTGALRVASSGTFTPALTSDRTSTGTITNTQSITISTSGGGAVVFNILGTWTGTIVFEYSVDGTNWVAANVNPYQGGTTPASSTTGNGQWTLNSAGLNSFRVRGNTVASGTATVWLEVGAGTSNALISMGVNGSQVPKPLLLDGSGNLDVNTQAAVFAAANGTATPTSAAWIGASDGTNLQGLLTESVGNKNLRVAIYNGGNIAAVTGANRLQVDIGSTGTVAVTGTVLVSNTTQNYTQGSTTSGQIGPLVQGAVTTGNPSYTTAQTSPLSLDTSGHLRTFDKADGLTGSPVPTTAIFIGGVGADSNLHGLSTDNTGKLNVNASFSGSVSTALPPDNSTTGTITSTQNVVLIFNSTTLGSTAQGGGAATFNITGSWTGTIVFEASTDGTNFYSVNAIPYPASGATVSSTGANGQWLIATGGLNSLRLRGSTVTSGTATVWIEVGIGSNGIFVLSPSASDFFATVTQGNAGTIGQSWFTKITDGTSVFGTTSSFPFTVTGTLTNNNAAPTSNNVGVLPARATGAAPTYTDGDQVLLSVDTTGALRVSSSGTFTPALTADITATGTITNTQSITLVTQGTGTTQFNITGSWTGTIVFEASVDGVNFVAAKCLPRYPTAFPEASQTTANGQWAIATGGLAKFRLRGNNVATGTATVWIEGGAGAQDIQTLAMVFDPVSGNVPAVKGSTTVPVAADNALVVALSPNSAQFATSTTANSLPGVNPITVGASSVAVVNSNAARKEVTIVNTGTTVIFLGFGQTPTTTAYHVALAKCTLANDGTGGTWTSDMWKGSVNAIGSAGGGTVVLTELT